MLVTGKFVFISEEVQEKDGTLYCAANMECEADGDIKRFNTSREVLAKMTKYKPYMAYLNVFEYTKNGNRQVAFRLEDVDAWK